MVILLTGATGFIGSRLHRALRDAGHRVIAAGRGLRGRDTLDADFTRDTREMQWRPRLAGVDVIVNAAGVFLDRPRGTMRLIHSAGPKALFSAAAEAGVRRVIQISALGADSRATEYFETKDDADRHLMSLPIEWAVLRPSLVFGLGGRTATWLLRLATAPVLVLPRAFRSAVQPVHVDDLVAAVVALVSTAELPRAPVPAVGGRAATMQTLVGSLRRQLGYHAAPALLLPDWLMRLVGKLPPLSREGYLGKPALRMLRAGHTAEAGTLGILLRRWPRHPDAFVPRGIAPEVGAQATLDWMLPLLRLAIAALWIWSAVVSLWLYPVADSQALLARVGIPEMLRSATLWASALLDFAIGLSILLWPRQPLVWSAQIAVVLGYTLIISIWMPEYWLHPFGPVSKNLPLLAAMYLLRRLSMRRWNT